MQSKISDLEAQVASLSLQSSAMDEERSLFNHRISTMIDTLAQRELQLMDANTQLAQVHSALGRLGLSHASVVSMHFQKNLTNFSSIQLLQSQQAQDSTQHTLPRGVLCCVRRMGML